jgi:hypothetical protein
MISQESHKLFKNLAAMYWLISGERKGAFVGI